MGFNYQALETLEQKMANDADSMTTWQSNTNTLIADNVGNPDVWKAASSCRFENRWEEFSTVNFPTYKKEFEDATLTVNETIETYKASEDIN